MFGIFEELDGTGSRFLCSGSLKSLTGRAPAVIEEHDLTGSRSLRSVSLKSWTGRGLALVGKPSSLCLVSLKSMTGRGPGLCLVSNVAPLSFEWWRGSARGWVWAPPRTLRVKLNPLRGNNVFSRFGPFAGGALIKAVGWGQILMSWIFKELDWTGSGFGGQSHSGLIHRLARLYPGY